MHKQMKTNAHCRPGRFFFGNLKRIVSEDRASRMRAWKNNRGGERRERRSGEREREGTWGGEEGKEGGDSAIQRGLCWHLVHRASVCSCLSPPLACGLLKAQDHALFYIPKPQHRLGRKGWGGKWERSSGASTRGQAPPRRRRVSPGTRREPRAPRLPRAAWDSVHDLTTLTWFNFKWAQHPILSGVLRRQKPPHS